ncbi:hypothetical protein [Endozoicomonas sp. 8E]|uniref:hypothetical protein n=1 Tax=Endozoicomonas sp. 8E TaxID=3035692 RepID=UPI002938FA2B|nr:hypothetical protein [Endozoicomonas sp. 8E]WOG29563.1 hypothetical protein P6910_07905 [Endozoicomonas sp. 8E]
MSPIVPWANQAKKDAMPVLVLWLWVQCLEVFTRKVMAFDEDSPFSEFEHILIHDGSSQAVYAGIDKIKYRSTVNYTIGNNM